MEKLFEFSSRAGSCRRGGSAIGQTCRSVLIISFAVISFFAVSMRVEAVPYIGNEVTYYQPDGEAIQVRLYGDEFYAVAETLDGHVIVKDPVTKVYSYADLSADGSEYKSTGIRVGKSKKRGGDASKEKARLSTLPKKQRIRQKARKEKSDAMRKHLGFDQAGRPLLDTVQPASGDTTTAVESADVSPVGNNGTRVTLVLLAKFPDREADVTITQSQIDNMFNADPYTEFGNATSVKGYYRIQSDNRVTLSSVVTAYFTAAHPRDYYTDPNVSYTSRAKELVIEGLNMLKSQNFDFSQLDGNGDQRVDAISLMYAGSTVNAWSEGLWPHASGVTWTDFSASGLITSASYQVTSLGNSLTIGTICHELGHAVFSFPDLYSYDGNASMVAKFCLMSSGNWGSGGRHPTSICGPLKYDVGWANFQKAYPTTSQSYTLRLDQNDVVLFVNPTNIGEYFTFEMRSNTGYEGPYGGDPVAVCPSPGLVVFHCLSTGSNTRSSIFTGDNPNCNYSKPYRCLLVERNPTTLYTPWYDDPTPELTDAFRTGDVLSSTTKPELKFWSASGRTVASGANINSILVSSNSISFRIGTPVVNYAPSANAQSVTTEKNIAKAITLTGSDPEGDALTYTIVTSPAHGTLSGTGANKTYTPATGYTGGDSFTFKVTDSKGAASANATVSITVTASGGTASCHIDTPSGNVTKTVGDTLAVTVSASDSDGVERVKIYLNGVEGPSDSSSPYEINLALTNAGTFTLTAKVKDMKGNYTDSDNSRTITVTSGSTTQLKTFTSVAAHDGYVDETSETSNAGGSRSSTLTSGTALRVGDTGARKQRRSFVSFNTASLPDNAVVTKAVLKLKRGAIVGAPTSLGSLTVDIKNTSFGFGTTEALESGDFQASASKSNVGTLSYPTANGVWATATLNADGISRINKTDHTQFRIRFTTDDDNDSTDDYLGFYPGDNATAANRPVLEVTYQ